jgi:mono/diheme cytochrome c family protein
MRKSLDLHKPLSLLCTLAVLCLIPGCSFRIEKGGGTPADASAIQPTQQQLDASSYAAVYAAVLQPHCISCHGSSGGVSLESYAAAFSALDKIKSVAIDSRQMPKPPEAALSVGELQILNAWILTNGRELPVDGSPPPPPPPPLTATYTSIKANIFELKCISCHHIGGKAQKYPFTSLAEIINNPDPVVISGSVAQSALNDVLQAGADKPMPPASSGYSPLSNDEIKAIQDWITNGLPE